MIKDVLNEIKSALPEGVNLCAVSKYHPVEALKEAYDAGQRVFGESHVQELQMKHEALPQEDIEWHFIGHLQTNKVKYIAPYISLIHSVDTERLLMEINKHGIRCGRRVPVLLQLHVAQEETKFGFSVEECRSLVESGIAGRLEGVEVRGIMCMASNTDDEERIRRDFHTAKVFFDEVFGNETTGERNGCKAVLSMGMSGDYPIAIQEGSTLVRIGSLIFGNRVY